MAYALSASLTLSVVISSICRWFGHCFSRDPHVIAGIADGGFAIVPFLVSYTIFMTV